jgi:hypothetical protein
MDSATLAKRLDEMTAIIKQLADSIKQLNSAYVEILETNKSLKDMVASGKYLEDFRAVLDELKKVKTVRQPDVFHEEYVPDYPVIGALYQKQVVVGDVYRKKMRVDHARLIHGILTNKLTSVEKSVALRLLSLSQRGGGSS